MLLGCTSDTAKMYLLTQKHSYRGPCVTFGKMRYLGFTQRSSWGSWPSEWGSLNLSPKDTALLHGLTAAHVAKKTARILRNPKFCSEFTTAPPPLTLILSHVNPDHVFRNYLFTILINITLSSTPGSSNWSLPLSILPNFYATLPLRNADVTLSDKQTSPISVSNVRSVQIMNLIIMQVTPTVCYFHPLTSKYSPQHHLLKCPQCTLRVKNRVTNTK